MSLLIDGYNLLHATDLFGTGQLAGTLQGSREALLAFLADRLTISERRRTTIVFDAAGAPPGLPDAMTWESIRVRYARGYPDADTLLEELIANWRGPKGLTVVSSDHRVQRAARSRGASYVDSDAWHSALRRRRRSVSEGDEAALASELPSSDYWVEEFADAELLDEFAKQDAALAQPRKSPAKPCEKSPSKKRTKRRRHELGEANSSATDTNAFGRGLHDPFPPGYAEDLARQLDDKPRE